LIFFKIGTIHIKVDTVLTKIGTVHSKFGEKSESVGSDFLQPAEFLNTPSPIHTKHIGIDILDILHLLFIH
jgi:hypothetical protein